MSTPIPQQQISAERRLIEELEKFEQISFDVSANIVTLASWQEKLMQALQASPPNIKGIKKDSELSKQIRDLTRQVTDCMQAWGEKWDARRPAKDLSDRFVDQAILLIFGKVNAGKSSFGNFLADRFSTNGKSVQYFYLSNGSLVDTPDRFQEGITETTARIQGVKLGPKLVVLDTPGLHSVTEENGSLTHRFTDSADAVLWLTSSTSPGQVQELDELKRELESGKPLLPVITKSDKFIEDEVDGEIVKILCNKTNGNRQLQEQDVKQRAAEKLVASGLPDHTLLAPVSVSAYAARLGEGADNALTDAGFDRLYNKILTVLEASLDYKRRKASEVMLHHLQENVLGALNNQILPQLDTIRRDAKNARDHLTIQQSHISSATVQEVVSRLPDFLEAHKEAQDTKAVCSDISKAALTAIKEQLSGQLGDYLVTLNKSLMQLSPDSAPGFETRSIEITQKKGATRKAAIEIGFATAGAALGTFIPIIGNIAGGILGGTIGGWLGSKSGEALASESIERRMIGVSYERLHASLDAEIRKALPKQIASLLDQCRNTITEVEQETDRLKKIIHDHTQQLHQIKEQLQ